MINILPTVLLPLLPIMWVLIASTYWWRQLSSPGLFFVAGLLALFGIQTIVSFLWDWWPHMSGDYFLEANNFIAGKTLSEAEMQRVLEEKNRAAIIQAALVLVAAIPLLWWLKRALSVK